MYASSYLKWDILYQLQLAKYELMTLVLDIGILHKMP